MPKILGGHGLLATPTFSTVRKQTEETVRLKMTLVTDDVFD